MYLIVYDVGGDKTHISKFEVNPSRNKEVVVKIIKLKT
jgi:hypothetical protein